MHKLYVYKQLYDFRTYIYRHNILKEISWNLKFINDKTDYPLHMIFNAKCPEYGLLSEFPALDIEDGWHFSIGHNQNWHELDNFYFPNDGIFKLYAYDETGRKDNDFFKHLCINNSVVGGWCILLFLEGFFHVTVDRFMNNKYYFCPYVKTEEEITAMCKSGWQASGTPDSGPNTDRGDSPQGENAQDDATTDTAAEQGDSEGIPVWVWIVGAAVLLIAGLVVALRMGKSQD